MSYIIKYDNREKDIIKILEESGNILIKENLDLGDIQIIDLDTKNIIIIIERKTLSDLSASIKDGRYKEQKERLIHSINNRVRKIMLIEGSNMSEFTLSKQTFNSIIINTLIRDNIHIHITKNINETIDFIQNIMLNIPKYYDKLKDNVVNGNINGGEESEHNIHKIKKDNLTPSICFRNMLCQINGISPSIAKIYVEKYGNMKNFINIHNSETTIHEIINILANEKNETNNRRIGEKIAEKICINIFGINEEDISNSKIKIKKTKKN
jgi:crossover junction endonuclease MUS81